VIAAGVQTVGDSKGSVEGWGAGDGRAASDNR